jgi:hypothetical protein
LTTHSFEKTSPACQADSRQVRIADSSTKNAVSISSAETLSIAAMRVSNPDRATFRIDG